MLPVLRTARLDLRPIDASDVEEMWPYVSDPELPRYMTWDAHKERSETEGFVRASVTARNEHAAYTWSIREDGVFSGLVTLDEIIRELRALRMDRAELGYWCAPPQQNRGVITEAARAVLGYAFGDMGLRKVIVGCLRENQPSRRVIEKLGFRLVGEQRDHAFRFGRWWDHILWEMTVDEWKALPA